MKTTKLTNEKQIIARSVHRQFAFWEDALAAVGVPNDSPHVGDFAGQTAEAFRCFLRGMRR